MSHKKIHIKSGQVFGRLTALHDDFLIGRNRWVNCLCSCGKTKSIRLSSLIRGYSASCGCYRIEQLKKNNSTHGYSRAGKVASTYVIWSKMKGRCKNEKTKDFPNYGGRGIKVCDRWQSFESFLKDMGERPVGMSIERINNDRNYEKSNCKWATNKEQARNRSSTRFIEFNGERRCISDWAEVYKIKRATLYARLKRGVQMNEAVLCDG